MFDRPPPPFSLSWRRHWPLSWIQDEGAHKRAAWHRLRCRELWLKCLALSWGPKAEAAQLRANPAALASISSSLSARILIMPVPSMCCAKHADNPLIHKPTHCHAISGTVDGGGGEKKNAISLLLVSVSLSFLFLDMTYFCFPHTQHFLPTFPFSVNFFFLSYSLHSPPLLYRGHCATCECYWFGRLAGVWPGVAHLLPGGLLSVPSQLSLRCVYCVCSESMHGIDFSDIFIFSP